MKEEIKSMIRKAERSIKAASNLCIDGDYDFAVSRAYYSMFYMAKACILTKGLSFSKHSGVLSAFNQHFVKTKIFPPQYYEILHSAFDNRNVGDYDFLISFPEDLTEEIIQNAQDFFEVTRKYLETFTNE
jgi:uncharacterized protein (UPF0332 family)